MYFNQSNNIEELKINTQNACGEVTQEVLNNFMRSFQERLNLVVQSNLGSDGVEIKIMSKFYYGIKTQNLNFYLRLTIFKLINYYGSYSRLKCGTLGFYTLYRTLKQILHTTQNIF